MNYDKIYPSIDLHGEYVFSAKELTKEFINDNITLKNKKICIVHGIGEGKLREMVHDLLKHDKRIKSYKLDFVNPGCTIAEIKEEYLWVN